MGWILLVMVFDLNGANVVPKQIIHKAYDTQQSCNDAGATFRGIVKLPADSKSMSVCVSSEWFETHSWQYEEMG